MATKHKNQKSRKTRNSRQRQQYRRSTAFKSRSEVPTGTITEHHRMMYVTMIDLLNDEGIDIPFMQPELGVHPTEDEVFMFFRGAYSTEKFNRVIVQSWNDCTFVLGYTPEITSVFDEEGVLVIARRFMKPPTQAEVEDFVKNEWNGLVGFECLVK